ncbi:MAG: MBL fold metallo-hydrolase [Candidatus Aenigmarchaeota archaeon]|nr:MBL fold metallo-hydrolase [Candidatus Aenigmarchaeota archaeon]
MRITKYPQSCILIEIENKKILVDPGRYCYGENFKPEDWKDIDVLLLTHGHTDHCSPDAVKTIYENNKPKIIGSKWVGEILSEIDVPHVIIFPGQEEVFEKFSIEAVKALHGESPVMSSSPKETVGFLIKSEKILYHCSDTLYMKDKPNADIVFVPISNSTITMGPKEAAIFVNEINPEIAIPFHYNSPKFPMDPKNFVDEMKGSGIEVKVLENKETILF